MSNVKSRGATLAVMAITLASPRAFSQDSSTRAPKHTTELRSILDTWVRNSSQIKTLSARFLRRDHRPGFGQQEYLYEVRWKDSGKAAINVQAVARQGKITEARTSPLDNARRVAVRKSQERNRALVVGAGP